MVVLLGVGSSFSLSSCPGRAHRHDEKQRSFSKGWPLSLLGSLFSRPAGSLPLSTCLASVTSSHAQTDLLYPYGQPRWWGSRLRLGSIGPWTPPSFPVHCLKSWPTWLSASHIAISSSACSLPWHTLVLSSAPSLLRKKVVLGYQSTVLM